MGLVENGADLVDMNEHNRKDTVKKMPANVCMHANYLRLFDYYGGKPARLFCFDQNRNIATQSNASKLVNSGKLDVLHFTGAACIPSTNNLLRLVDSVVSGFGQSHTTLPLVFATTVFVRCFTNLIAFKE